MWNAELAMPLGLHSTRDLHAYKQAKLEPNTNDPTEIIKTNLHTMTQYRRTLEKELIEVLPEVQGDLLYCQGRSVCGSESNRSGGAWV